MQFNSLLASESHKLHFEKSHTRTNKNFATERREESITKWARRNSPRDNENIKSSSILGSLWIHGFTDTNTCRNRAQAFALQFVIIISLVQAKTRMYSHGVLGDLGGIGDHKRFNQQSQIHQRQIIIGMEWTRDKTLTLLREYQQRRVLWDWNARGYRDRVKRKRAIQDLAEILHCNVLEVEKKITNLKCQYSREVHKIQNSRETATGPDDVYVSKWFAFKAMQFLQFGTRRYSKRKKVSAMGEKTKNSLSISSPFPSKEIFIFLLKLAPSSKALIEVSIEYICNN